MFQPLEELEPAQELEQEPAVLELDQALVQEEVVQVSSLVGVVDLVLV